MTLRQAASYALVALGLLQISGYLLEAIPLRAIGAASAASPLPIVFSDVKGLETFASEFSVTLNSTDGTSRRLSITPREYAKFPGPYNRRNVYGAAISYGHRLPELLWKSVLYYGFCHPGTLVREMGLGQDFREVIVHIETKTAGRNDKWQLALACR